MKLTEKQIKIIVAVAFILVIVIGVLTSDTGSSNKSNNKYDYVTNSDGSRTWYDTSNSHIVRID